MGYTIGIPCLKLNNAGRKSKHCGNFGAVAAEALEERKGRDADIDVNKSSENIYTGFRSAEALRAYSRDHVAELSAAQQAAGKRKIRDDAVVMVSTIVKPPAAYMATLAPEQRIQFLKDAGGKLAEIVGAENVKSEAIHVDEQGDHLHVFWEPMTSDGRLCAKEIVNLKLFNRLNKELPPFLRSRGWDIDDCKAYDEAEEQLKSEQAKSAERKRRGLTSVEYKAQAEAQKNELCEQIDGLKLQVAHLERRADQAEARVAELEERVDLIESYEEYTQAADEIEEQATAISRLLDSLRGAIRLFKRREAEEFINDFKTSISGVFEWLRAHLSRVIEYEVATEMPEPKRRSPSLADKIAAAEAKRQDVGPGRTELDVRSSSAQKRPGLHEDGR